jgi:hypothetical protein
VQDVHLVRHPEPYEHKDAGAFIATLGGTLLVRETPEEVLAALSKERAMP